MKQPEHETMILSDEQALQLAKSILPLIRSFIESHKQEHKEWKADQKRKNGE